MSLQVQDTFSRDKTQLIWLCAPPVSVEVWGGLMVEGMEFQRRSMRFNVMEGNLMVALTTAAYGFDVLDLHYWMTHQIHKRMPDGIHWTQDAVRLQTNIILTHFCLSRDIKLPGRLIVLKSGFSVKFVLQVGRRKEQTSGVRQEDRRCCPCRL